MSMLQDSSHLYCTRGPLGKHRRKKAVGAVGAYRASCDVLSPLAHVGAVFEGSATPLLLIPTAVGVPCIQAHPAVGKIGRGQKQEQDSEKSHF